MDERAQWNLGNKPRFQNEIKIACSPNTTKACTVQLRFKELVSALMRCCRNLVFLRTWGELRTTELR